MGFILQICFNWFYKSYAISNFWAFIQWLLQQHYDKIALYRPASIQIFFLLIAYVSLW